MFRRLLIKFGLVEAKIGFYGIDTTERERFVYSVRARGFVQPECQSRFSFEKFYFQGIMVHGVIAPGNRGGRQPFRDELCDYDGIAFFIDATDDDGLRLSWEELDSILSDEEISQHIVILVPQKKASGCANEPALLAEFGLEDVVSKANGRVALFGYSLSEEDFIGCDESLQWLINHI
ncbi:hypothetical protein GALMADRAFT_229205 [Galerina marginata CBS 339.88]|uniref:Uncharacterized protein n=1 Tax=Galerina marginata (strain CBS 339.88) TaxID=685588 RepID=A0A067SZ29_GALM3|nr:hypothetical protein GALMADRAFT_229205 [Galerina marginata CBS 339.88]